MGPIMGTTMNHKGMLRQELNLTTNKRRGRDEELPRLNILSNVMLRNKLQQLVRACAYRVETDKRTNAPCCRAEGGKVFRCSKYNYEPAKFWDCMICKKNEAIRSKAEWITPLVSLSQGSVPSGYSLEQVLHMLSGGS